MNKTVVVSGGFDPLHVGHLQMFEEAKALGEPLYVIVNNDNWIKKKKGKPFMNELDRLRIIKALRVVDEVVLSTHKTNPKDMSVCEELKIIKPAVFANGGDRKKGNVPEYELCEKLGVQMVFDVGGGKIRSSSEMVKNAKD